MDDTFRKTFENLHQMLEDMEKAFRVSCPVSQKPGPHGLTRKAESFVSAFRVVLRFSRSFKEQGGAARARRNRLNATDGLTRAEKRPKLSDSLCLNFFFVRSLHWLPHLLA
jgi:hypothetical protein